MTHCVTNYGAYHMHLYCPLQHSKRGKGFMQARVRIHFKSAMTDEFETCERWQSVAAIATLHKSGASIDAVIISDAARHSTEEKAT